MFGTTAIHKNKHRRLLRCALTEKEQEEGLDVSAAVVRNDSRDVAVSFLGTAQHLPFVWQG